MRDDCVSYQHNGTEFVLMQSECSSEMQILCDVETFRIDGTTDGVERSFVTAGEYPLEEADAACISEMSVTFSVNSITLAFASAEPEAVDGGLQAVSTLNSEKAYGTGFTVCTHDAPGSSVLETRNFDYVQCAGESDGTAKGLKRDAPDMERQAEAEDRPIKRKKGSGRRQETSGAMVGLRHEVIEQLKARLGFKILNHFTLPVGQGSCQIMQCIQVPLSLTNFADNLIIDNVVYDCGSDGYIGNSSAEREDASVIPTFVRWIADFLVREGNQLLAKTLLNLVDQSSTNHVVVSHTDSDHNSLLNGIWQSNEKVPGNWTLGGRRSDFKRQPLQAIMRRLNAGSSVVVNGATITSASSAEDLRSQIPVLPNAERSNLVGGALSACGDAGMRLLAINTGIAPLEVQRPSGEQLNSVSAVVTLEVPDRMVAVLPGDAIHTTWEAAIQNAAGTPVGTGSAGIGSFPVRHLTSPHHGSFTHGSNDSLAGDYVDPTHVVFSHATQHRHVHNKAWHTYWNSVAVNEALSDGALAIKDSYQPEIEEAADDGSPTSATEVLGSIEWQGDVGGGWQYKASTTDVQKRALIGTYTNGLVWGSLSMSSAPGNETAGFVLHRVRIAPIHLLTDILNPIFVQGLD